MQLLRYQVQKFFLTESNQLRDVTNASVVGRLDKIGGSARHVRAAVVRAAAAAYCCTRAAGSRHARRTVRASSPACMLDCLNTSASHTQALCESVALSVTLSGRALG